MSKQKIILYGAFDRYNYGDIIIAIILRNYLKNNGFKNIEFCSIKNVDLTHLGGFKCNVLDPQHTPKNSTIIVTGGEILNVDWTSITSYYMGWFGNRLIRIARLIFPRSWINSLCIKMINGLFKHPFLVEKTNFADSIQIIYNGVGGVSIKISDKSIKSVLLDADLISVRDLHSNHILESKWGLKNKLTPDIANALSQFYPKNKLLKSTTKKTKAFISKNNNNYFCFQIAQQYENKKLSLIINSLSKILSKGTSIALLPLGIVSGHEDNRILEKIYKRLPSEKVFLLREIHLIDSISLIAHSSVFAGTSLHGNITAMSYAVPHFPLNEHINKLINYVKKWDVPQIKACPDYSQIYKFYEKYSQMDKQLLLKNRTILISYIDENIARICKIISSEY